MLYASRCLACAHAHEQYDCASQTCPSVKPDPCAEKMELITGPSECRAPQAPQSVS